MNEQDRKLQPQVLLSPSHARFSPQFVLIVSNHLWRVQSMMVMICIFIMVKCNYMSVCLSRIMFTTLKRSIFSSRSLGAPCESRKMSYFSNFVLLLPWSSGSRWSRYCSCPSVLICAKKNLIWKKINSLVLVERFFCRDCPVITRFGHLCDNVILACYHKLDVTFSFWTRHSFWQWPVHGSSTETSCPPFAPFELTVKLWDTSSSFCSTAGQNATPTMCRGVKTHNSTEPR